MNLTKNIQLKPFSINWKKGIHKIKEQRPFLSTERTFQNQIPFHFLPKTYQKPTCGKINQPRTIFLLPLTYTLVLLEMTRLKNRLLFCNNWDKRKESDSRIWNLFKPLIFSFASSFTPRRLYCIFRHSSIHDCLSLFRNILLLKPGWIYRSNRSVHVKHGRMRFVRGF